MTCSSNFSPSNYLLSRTSQNPMATIPTNSCCSTTRGDGTVPSLQWPLWQCIGHTTQCKGPGANPSVLQKQKKIKQNKEPQKDIWVHPVENTREHYCKHPRGFYVLSKPQMRLFKNIHSDPDWLSVTYKQPIGIWTSWSSTTEWRWVGCRTRAPLVWKQQDGKAGGHRENQRMKAQALSAYLPANLPPCLGINFIRKLS